MDSRSQPSKSVAAPLVRCPSCAASKAARRTCQIHRPALLALLALANTALLRSGLPACQPLQSAPFRLCRCLNGKLWVTTSSVVQG